MRRYTHSIVDIHYPLNFYFIFTVAPMTIIWRKGAVNTISCSVGVTHCPHSPVHALPSINSIAIIQVWESCSKGRCAEKRPERLLLLTFLGEKKLRHVRSCESLRLTLSRLKTLNNFRGAFTMQASHPVGERVAILLGIAVLRVCSCRWQGDFRRKY